MNKRTVLLFIIMCILFISLIIYGSYVKFLNSKNDSTINNTLDISNQKESVNKFIEANNFEEISKYINTGKKIIVLGRTGCVHCVNYKPLIKEVTNEYKISIMYIDIKKLVENDLNSLLDSDIMIPEKCSSDNKESKLRNGFGTPLTLFLENGKSFDCIRGYVDKNTLINSLKEAKYILQ